MPTRRTRSCLSGLSSIAPVEGQRDDRSISTLNRTIELSGVTTRCALEVAGGAELGLGVVLTPMGVTNPRAVP